MIQSEHPVVLGPKVRRGMVADEIAKRLKAEYEAKLAFLYLGQLLAEYDDLCAVIEGEEEEYKVVFDNAE